MQEQTFFSSLPYCVTILKNDKVKFKTPKKTPTYTLLLLCKWIFLMCEDDL